MVVNEPTKANRSVRPKLKPIDGNNAKSVPKTEKKHRLKQRFEVIKKLGQGTYGKVQLAINKETGQEVSYNKQSSRSFCNQVLLHYVCVKLLDI